MLWDAGVAITATGVISPASSLVRVALGVIPAYLSHSDDVPPRYRYLGRVGWSLDGYQDQGQSLVYASQVLEVPAVPFDAIWYVLATGVSGILYQSSGGTDVAQVVGCTVRRTTSQSIPNNATTAVSFDSSVHDPYGLHESVTNPTRITIKEPGWYAVFGQVAWSINTAQRLNLNIRLNGSGNVAEGESASVAGQGVANTNISATWLLETDDYLELTCYQASGAAVNISSYVPSQPSLTVVKIG